MTDRAGSSVVEPSAHNRRVGGSNPSRRTNITLRALAPEGEALRRRIGRILGAMQELHSWRTRLALWLAPDLGGIILDGVTHRMAELHASLMGRRVEALRRWHAESYRRLGDGVQTPVSLSGIVLAMEKESGRDV